MTIQVRGIGWITDAAYGCVRIAEQHAYGTDGSPDRVPKNELFSYPVKNFGRFDAVSRMTCFAVALALKDAGMAYSALHKQDIGIIGTSAQGSLRSDIDYFTDYLESGRTLSRGNLFIYTLPSSPLGEAAIHFGLLGPVLFAADRLASILSVMDTAADMLIGGETPLMLAGKTDEKAAIYLVLEQDPQAANGSLCDLAEARTLVGEGSDITAIIEVFSRMLERKGTL